MLTVKVNGKVLVPNLIGDGLIVASPYGSSAYFYSIAKKKFKKGLGLGLFLAKFIIEASGGEINFESEEGVGSKFWFSLPAVN